MEPTKFTDAHLDQARFSQSIQGLDVLRQGAQSGDRKALEETAKQFEAIFLHMMLKSMRAAEDVLADDSSPFNSKQVKFYRDMHDQQLASNMAATGNVGLAEVIVQQLDPAGSGMMPAGVLRSGANLDDLQNLRNMAPLKLEDVEQSIASVLRQSGKEPEQPLDQISTPSKKPAFDSPESFIENLLPIAKEIAADLGLDPKAMVSQAAVETGWGKYLIHSGDGKNSHNLFGVKASRGWQGDKNYVETLEFQGDTPRQTKAAFRAYDSFADSMRDYVDFIKTSPRYNNAVENSADPKRYFSELQQSGYATDPNYADKVLSVFNSERLNGIARSLGI